MSTSIETPDWSKLPKPEDDGAARHLVGTLLPSQELRATNGALVNLSTLPGRTIVYAYPRNGQPGVDNPPGWDAIPGARGCTPQTCAFRDHYAELKRLEVQHVFGLSTQDTDYQKELATRLHLPFALLSDCEFRLSRALNLPTFETNGMKLLKRLTLIIDNGRIRHVLYPVFPPDQNAEEVIKWIQANQLVFSP